MIDVLSLIGANHVRMLHPIRVATERDIYTIEPNSPATQCRQSYCAYAYMCAQRVVHHDSANLDKNLGDLPSFPASPTPLLGALRPIPLGIGVIIYCVCCFSSQTHLALQLQLPGLYV